MRTLRLAIAFALCAAVASVSAQAISKNYELNIPRQPLETALKEFASQTGLQVARFADTVDGSAVVGPVTGKYSAEEALRSLLSSSGLTYKVVNDRTIAVMNPDAGASERKKGEQVEAGSSLQRTNTEQVKLPHTSLASDQDLTGNPQGAMSERANSRLELEEIVVTGTNIRGGTSASPVTNINREQIESSGYNSIDDVVQSLPLAFGGGAQRDTSFGDLGSDSTNNLSRGATINLRGLGAHATLVLLNGHRLPGSGPGQLTDISMIPVSVVDRLEIVSDGASAIYGTDAVAGVVNIITRDGYDGSSVGAHYGAATSGGYDERGASATFGHQGETASFALSYDYLDQANLASDRRDFSGAVDDPTDLFGSDERHSVFLTATLKTAPSASLSVTAYGSWRDTQRTFTFFGTSNERAKPSQYGGTVDFNYELPRDWQVELFAGYGRSEVEDAQFNILTPANVSRFDYNQTYDAAEIKLDGPLARLPGGELRAAIGGSFRTEKYEQKSSVDPATNSNDTRDISAGFAEFLLPLFGPENEKPGLERLDLTLALRSEHYDDFGSTTNPKAGLVWQPIKDIRFRATYGTSFRAPTFSEIRAQAELAALLYLPDPSSPTGLTLTLYRPYGHNRLLQPETADTFTAGIDFLPEWAPGVHLGATYFDISYSDRITQPIANVVGAFANEHAYGSAVDRTPDPALLASLIAMPSTPTSGFANFTGQPFDIGDIQAIVDNRYQNIAKSRVDGVDFFGNYRRAIGRGQLEIASSATFLLSYAQSIGDNAPQVDLRNRSGQPIDFRARIDVGYSVSSIDAHIAINYADSYENRDVVPTVPIASWTTVDARLQYTWRASRVALVVQNLFDRNPPFVSSALNLQLPLGYDPTNANPLGRVIALDINQRF